jgi:hypothetical protein
VFNHYLLHSQVVAIRTATLVIFELEFLSSVLSRCGELIRQSTDKLIQAVSRAT